MVLLNGSKGSILLLWYNDTSIFLFFLLLLNLFQFLFSPFIVNYEDCSLKRKTFFFYLLAMVLKLIVLSLFAFHISKIVTEILMSIMKMSAFSPVKRFNCEL